MSKKFFKQDFKFTIQILNFLKLLQTIQKVKRVEKWK